MPRDYDFQFHGYAEKREIKIDKIHFNDSAFALLKLLWLLPPDETCLLQHSMLLFLLFCFFIYLFFFFVSESCQTKIYMVFIFKTEKSAVFHTRPWTDEGSWSNNNNPYVCVCVMLSMNVIKIYRMHINWSKAKQVLINSLASK